MSTTHANVVSLAFRPDYVPLEAGQTLLGTPAVCDANGICRTTATQRDELQPSDVVLDPNKHYYISVMRGDGINPTVAGVAASATLGVPVAARTTSLGFGTATVASAPAGCRMPAGRYRKG